MYAVSDSKVGKQRIANLFNTRSNAWHTEKRTLLAPLFKLSNLLEYESLIDDTINSFCAHLEERFVNHPNENKPCKMEDWLYFFAWDVLAQLTFSRPMGFMDSGADKSSILSTSEKAIDYFAVVSQLPWLDEWLVKNPIIRIGPVAFDNTANFCIQQCIARQQRTDGKVPGRNDMLDDLLELKVTESERMSDNDVIGCLLLNIHAGSDTTGILLKAIVYYVLKNPQVHIRLQRELDDAGLKTPVSYAAASKLIYLDAVIREAWRIHPSVGMLLERVVPEGGLELQDGTVLPPGSKVGMNSWVIHQSKSIFGQDAASFRPERWLRYAEHESESVYLERIANMKRHDLTFGAGKRVCLGKEMALLETFKVIATLFLKYNVSISTSRFPTQKVLTLIQMSFVDPEKEWRIENFWFARQSGVDIKLERVYERHSRRLR
jgi:cytochrome P450